jgi:hypothetical protein
MIVWQVVISEGGVTETLTTGLEPLYENLYCVYKSHARSAKHAS